MALNTTITESPLLLFLGAGASAALGKPTMKQFVENLNQSLSEDSTADLLRYLTAMRDNDLEAITRDLEIFLDIPYLSSIQCEMGTQEQGVVAKREQALRLRWLIRHAIIKEYRDIEFRRVLEVYRPLFETLFSFIDTGRNCLPVFTTNYDLAIETFCHSTGLEFNLVDGLEHDTCEQEVTWNPSEFEHFRLWGGAANIVLFKLHGSVDWIRVLNTNKVIKAAAMYDALDFDAYQNVLIYPAGDKMAIGEPYLTAYRYFSKCCESARIIVAIGYSFRDYNVLNALITAREAREELYLIIVSPNAFQVAQSIPHEDTLLWVGQVFGSFGHALNHQKYIAEIAEKLKWKLKK